MRLTDVMHHIGPRAVPTVGAGVGGVVVLLGAFGEAEWHKALTLAAAAVYLASHLIKLAMDVNGLGKFIRGYNQVQDAQLEDHERRLKALEDKA